MRSVGLQICGIAGIVVILNRLWQDAPLESTLVTGAFVSLGVYVAIVCVDLAARYVLTSPLFSSPASSYTVRDRADDSGADKGRSSDEKRQEATSG